MPRVTESSVERLHRTPLGVTMRDDFRYVDAKRVITSEGISAGIVALTKQMFGYILDVDRMPALRACPALMLFSSRRAAMQQPEPRDDSVLTALFHPNTWANLKLLDYCERLSDEQLEATATGTYGSIRDTLLHIVGAEVSYVQRVNGKLPCEPPPRDQFPGFAMLKDAARWTGEELPQLALAARADTIVHQRRPGFNANYKLASLMVQAINHSTEHRTQVSTILTQLGLEPPDMTGWQYMEEMGEIEDISTEAS
jgi:uncharacterized damage-inducible protein DinB